MYCYFPAALFAIMLIFLTFLIQLEPPKFLISEDRIEEAKEVLPLIYQDCKTKNVDGYISFIRT